ncbi:MAG: HD domain-containing protein [Betaproteobacteria bacterium]
MRVDWFCRFRQVLNHLDPRPLPPSALAWVERHLSPAERELFLALRLSDQRHAVAAARLVARKEELSLRERWVAVRAALLHDVGKGPVRPGLMVRMANVVWPGGPPRWLPASLRERVNGLRNHPVRGAALLRKSRTDPAVVLLVRWHEAEGYPQEVPEELHALLDLLRWADSGSKGRRL